MDLMTLLIILIVILPPFLICGYGAASELIGCLPTYTELTQRRADKRHTKKGYTKRELNQSAHDDWQAQYDRLLGIKPAERYGYVGTGRIIPPKRSQTFEDEKLRSVYWWAYHSMMEDHQKTLKASKDEAEKIKRVAMQSRPAYESTDL